LEPNYYQLLGVRRTASILEIKQAFKALAIKYHPDKNPGSKFHEEHFKQISAAYDMLADDDKRLKYDLKLMYQEQRAETQAAQSATSSKSSTAAKRPAPNYRYAQPAYKRRKPNDEAQAQSKITSWFQKVGTAALVSACVIMLGVWMSDIRNQVKVGKYLASGNYAMALNYDSSSADAYFLRAQGAIKVNNYRNALADLQKAIYYSNDAFDASLYYNQRAKLYTRMGLYDESLSDYEKITQLRPDSAGADYDVAEFHYNHTRQYKQAFKWYMRALNKKSTSDVIMIGLIRSAYNVKEYGLAEFYANQLMSYIDLPEAHYIKGMSIIAQKKPTNLACEEFTKALGLREAIVASSEYCP
jgi:curved DNA-binding protein CbpA